MNSFSNFFILSDPKNRKVHRCRMEGKKPKANPAFGERKKRQKDRVFTGIKTGVIKICRDDAMYALLQVCVSRSSLIAVEASLLTSLM